MSAAHPLKRVKVLAAHENTREVFGVVLTELTRWGLDTDDLAYTIVEELGDAHWYKSEVTKKYYPGTVSDYYSVWVEACTRKMFIKLLVRDAGDDGEILVVTSFKKDDRYDDEQH